MIPIRDTAPTRNHAVVNTAIIALNVVLYLVQYSQSENLGRFIYIYGLVPARYSVPHIASYFSPAQQILSLISFMFLHGGFWHLLGNMWSLYIFGNNIEDHLGSLRYLLFYLLCGIVSGITHIVLNPGSNIPTIGASGAIAGVMGAYLILYPRSKILTLIPIIFIPWFVEIPAFFFLGFWFVLQFINAAGSHGGASGGIAWWAHVGGFVGGILLLALFKRLPPVGFTGRLRRVTERRGTHRLQVIRPLGKADDAHLYGVIHISGHESRKGVRKLVNIAWGFHNRMIRVAIPAGIRPDSKLRLRGLGKQAEPDRRGDLFLKVLVDN